MITLLKPLTLLIYNKIIKIKLDEKEYTFDIFRRFDDQAARIKHVYEDLIRTPLHNMHLSPSIMEMFFLEEDSKNIQSVTNGFLIDKKMNTVKLVAL